MWYSVRRTEQMRREAGAGAGAGAGGHRPSFCSSLKFEVQPAGHSRWL